MNNLVRFLIAAICFAVFPSALYADRGGPDRGGYDWIDSNEKDGGVTYEWIETPISATEVTLEDDSESDPISLGFNFRFYGVVYNQIYIGSNGYLSFRSNDYSGVPGQCPFPDESGPNLSIFGFYQDFNPELETSGPIVYFTDGDKDAHRFVVTFDGVEIYQRDPGSDPVTFQIVLYEETSEIQVNVQDSGELAGGAIWDFDATIGIDNADGSSGLGLCPGEIADEYAVRFVRSNGLLLEPRSLRQTGIPGESVEFNLELINFSTEELSATVETESASGWNVAPDSPSLTVTPDGQVTEVGVTVEVPAEASGGANDQIGVTITIGETVLEAQLIVVVTFPPSSWQTIDELPAALSNVALVSDENYLYAIGGMTREEEGDMVYYEPSDRTFRWDTEYNWWYEEGIANLPVPLTSGGACLMNGHIYYIGGFDGEAADEQHWSFSPDIHIYNIENNTWTTGTPPPRATAQANVACDPSSESVFVLNGYTDVDGNGDYLDREAGGQDITEAHTFVYDAMADNWSQRAPSDEAVSGSGTGILNGQLILAGGFFDDVDDPKSSGWVTRATRIYSIATNEWTDGPWLSGFLSRTAGFVYENHFCVVGGTRSGESVPLWECMADQVWIIQVDELSYGRSGLGATTMGEHMYAIAGSGGDFYSNRAERWPATDLNPSTPIGGDGDADADADADVDSDVESEPPQPRSDGGCQIAPSGKRANLFGTSMILVLAVLGIRRLF